MTRINKAAIQSGMAILSTTFIDDSPPLNPNVRENLLPVQHGIGNFDITQEIHGLVSFIRVTRITAANLPNALANFGRQNPNHGRIISVKRCK